MAAQVAVVPARGCVCLLCNTVCSNQTTIRRHFLLAHYDDGTAYRCPACQALFQARHIFRQHIFSKHKDMTMTRQDYDKCRVVGMMGHFVGSGTQ